MPSSTPSSTLRHGRPPRMRGWARTRLGSSRPRSLYLRLYHHLLTAHNDRAPNSPAIWTLVLPGGRVNGYPKRKELRVKCRNGERLVFVVKTKEMYELWLEGLGWGTREIGMFWKVVHGRVLGEGAFAQVVFGFDVESGDHAAIKVVEKRKCSKKELECAEVEARICAVVEHPSLVQVLDIFDDTNDMHVVMQFMDGGTLEQRMNQRSSRNLKLGSVDTVSDIQPRLTPFSEDDARKVSFRLLSALHYLHSARIVHRDIKPNNILLQDIPPLGWASTARLGDFGLAAFVDDNPDALLSEVVGTPEYLAPEIISRNEDNQRPGYSTPVDVWAAGVLSYWMLSGCLPFDGVDNGTVLRKIRNEEPDMDTDSCWEQVSDSAKSLILSLLNKDPARRLTAIGALAHPWFGLAEFRRGPAGPRGALHGRLRNYRDVWRVVVHALIALRGIHTPQKKKATLKFSDFNYVEVVECEEPKDRAPEMAPSGLNGLGYNVGLIPSLSPRRRARTGNAPGSRQRKESGELSRKLTRKLTGSSSFSSTASRTLFISRISRGRDGSGERSREQQEEVKKPEKQLPYAPGVNPIALGVGLWPVLGRKSTKPANSKTGGRSRFMKATPT